MRMPNLLTDWPGSVRSAPKLLHVGIGLSALVTIANTTGVGIKRMVGAARRLKRQVIELNADGLSATRLNERLPKPFLTLCEMGG